MTAFPPPLGKGIQNCWGNTTRHGSDGGGSEEWKKFFIYRVPILVKFPPLGKVVQNSGRNTTRHGSVDDELVESNKFFY